MRTLVYSNSRPRTDCQSFQKCRVPRQAAYRPSFLERGSYTVTYKTVDVPGYTLVPRSTSKCGPGRPRGVSCLSIQEVGPELGPRLVLVPVLERLHARAQRLLDRVPRQPQVACDAAG